MKYRTVGKTGVQVSYFCFGTMSFGGNADEEPSKAMFERCREVGINFFDNELPFHLARARENGVSLDELAELFTHLAFYAGWPSAITAVNRAMEVFAETE